MSAVASTTSEVLGTQPRVKSPPAILHGVEPPEVVNTFRDTFEDLGSRAAGVRRRGLEFSKPQFICSIILFECGIHAMGSRVKPQPQEPAF